MMKVIAAPTYLLGTVLTSGSAFAHGGLSINEDYCKLRIGQYLMHFVGYQSDTPSGPKEFCEDIPATGHTIVVLDYLHEELVSRFPFSVGKRRVWLPVVIPVVLIIVGVVVLHRFGMRRRSKAMRSA